MRDIVVKASVDRESEAAWLRKVAPSKADEFHPPHEFGLGDIVVLGGEDFESYNPLALICELLSSRSYKVLYYNGNGNVTISTIGSLKIIGLHAKAPPQTEEEPITQANGRAVQIGAEAVEDTSREL